MTISFSLGRKSPANVAVAAFGVTEEGLQDPACRTDLTTDLEALGFTAKVGQVQLLPQGKQIVAAVGLGPSEKLVASELRSAAAALARATTKYKSVSCDLAHVSNLPTGTAIRAVVEGMGLASYEFGYKSKKSEMQLNKVVLTGSTSASNRKALNEAIAVLDAVMLARDLVNEPGWKFNPSKICQQSISDG